MEGGGVWGLVTGVIVTISLKTLEDVVSSFILVKVLFRVLKVFFRLPGVFRVSLPLYKVLVLSVSDLV